MRDTIGNVISYCGMSCCMDKISVNDKY